MSKNNEKKTFLTVFLVFSSTEVIEIGVAVEVLAGVGDAAAAAKARKKQGEVEVAQEIVTEDVDVKAVVGVEAVQEAQTKGAKAMIREKDAIEKKVSVVVRVHQVGGRGTKQMEEIVALLCSVLKGGS